MFYFVVFLLLMEAVCHFGYYSLTILLINEMRHVYIENKNVSDIYDFPIQTKILDRGNLSNCKKEPGTMSASYLGTSVWNRSHFDAPKAFAKLMSNTGDKYMFGYCWSNLHCPISVPISYVEVPKAGCSTMKKYLHELDGLNWSKRHRTKHICCRNGIRRLRVQITRNPFTRLISGFVDKKLKKNMTFTPEQILKAFRKHVTHVTTHDDQHIDHHFKSQVYFGRRLRQAVESEKSKTKQWCNEDILYIKIENLYASGISQIENILCRDHQFCAKLPQLGRENKSPSRPEYKSDFLLQDSSLVDKVVSRYQEDFDNYGYSTTLL